MAGRHQRVRSRAGAAGCGGGAAGRARKAVRRRRADRAGHRARRAARVRPRDAACAPTEAAWPTRHRSAGAPDDHRRRPGRRRASRRRASLGMVVHETVSGPVPLRGGVRQLGQPSTARSAFCTSIARLLDFGKAFAIKLGDDDALRRPHHGARGALSRRTPTGARRAGRGPAPGPAHDAAHAHLRRRERRRRHADRSPAITG